MMRFSAFVLSALLVAAAAAAETIHLDGGQTVRADVLREYADRVIVDLGFELLTIPRERIRRIEQEPTAAGAPQATHKTDDLYSTARLSEEDIQKLAERFGEAVVLVTTP